MRAGLHATRGGLVSRQGAAEEGHDRSGMGWNQRRVVRIALEAASEKTGTATWAFCSLPGIAAGMLSSNDEDRATLIDHDCPCPCLLRILGFSSISRLFGAKAPSVLTRTWLLLVARLCSSQFHRSIYCSTTAMKSCLDYNSDGEMAGGCIIRLVLMKVSGDNVCAVRSCNQDLFSRHARFLGLSSAVRSG